MKLSVLAAALAVAALVLPFSGCRKHEKDAHAAQQPVVRPTIPQTPPPGGAGGGDDEEGGGNPLAVGSGAKKWRDTGVYVDGRPIGVLNFGELPTKLQPVWVEEEHSVEFGPDDKGPRTRKSVERRYRFTDYLKAVGVDLNKVKTLHVLGPKITEVISVSGKELRARGKEFLFRFGVNTGGKAMPVVPDNFGNRVKPDKIAAVMVYIDKKAPDVVFDEGLVLDGKPVDGIPYYGDPLRGGIRIYQDDRFATAIKRPMLRETKPDSTVNGRLRYRLWPLLEANGIDTKKIVEGWLIADERRKQKLGRAELEALTFEVGEKEKNEILVGDGKLRVNAIALHDHALKENELPKFRPEEEAE